MTEEMLEQMEKLARLKAEHKRAAKWMSLLAIIVGGAGMLLNRDSMVLFGILCAIYAQTLAITQ